MTKMSKARKIKKGIVAGPAPVERRNLSPQECTEILEMQRLVNVRRYEAAEVKNNTALVPDGQRVAAELAALAALLENSKNHRIGQILSQCGWPQDAKCAMNLTTGEVTDHVEEIKTVDKPVETGDKPVDKSGAL